MKEELRVKVYDGKYEFVSPSDDWRIHILRYGEPWIILEEGHNAIWQLMFELDELRNEKSQKKILV